MRHLNVATEIFYYHYQAIAIDASNLSTMLIRNTSHLESRRDLFHCIDDTLTCFFFLLEILAEG
jgi:hypothetical protein